MNDQPSSDGQRELAKIAQGLRTEVTDVRKLLAILVRRSRRQRRTMIAIAALAVVTLALVLLVGAQQRQISAQQAQAATTRHVVLCPLYQALLDFVIPTRRAQLPQAQQLGLDHVSAVVRQGYDSLRCSEP
ncbi:MAG: hypothetical protein ACRDRO_21675 [Pseudonocardiaceae bacterium]